MYKRQHQRRSFTLVVMYLSGRFLLAIRMPFGVELNSTFFYSLPDDDQHGRKKK